ncbi:protein disulfide-isomerase precursor [Lobosporangium transversale]|uniref:Putative NADH-dependent flavin oxidoreductase n=1 Tax=Lobosporangium transversale TaxID=64571 RepID=A0A1Y2GSI8_9FUNG|nr:putative NADH-dependent flavin oxidoreductase [Lobosporangium transversale]KAF9907165.1 protein disulfide-isomerase precursor [Lobosporangium transversale]ORZ19948.1 putative NADH-dependent flavin oxidoreductase [Lobosporangium transversale]|eukprot:XP_021882488.1 putative NADH-dependent flavin oxidoreductase [Lobosporangium transversale]
MPSTSTTVAAGATNKPTYGTNIHYQPSQRSVTVYDQESFFVQPKVAPGTSLGLKSAIQKTPLLFQPFTIKDLTIANRLVVAPMCMYSSRDGFVTDFHLAHLGSFAINGAGLIIQEATAVEPRGRISPGDAGIWSDDHISGIKRIVDFVHAQGSKIGIQLAHAGRKASTDAPANTQVIPESEYWNDDVVAPSGGPELQWDDKHRIPRALSIEEIQDIVQAFGAAAARAAKAGMDTVEIHGAHGYLIHNFLSPITNKRTDKYGGSLENRARFLLEVIEAVRANFPAERPIFLRISASDAVEHLDIESWDIEQSVQLARWVKDAGIDAIHVSSAGNTSLQKVTYSPGYQVHYAERIRKEVPGLVVIAVGSITSGKQAEEILQEGKADLIAAARAFLKRPSFALDAARDLGVEPAYSLQYFAAKYA